MMKKSLVLSLFLSTLAIAPGAQAENLNDLATLFSTRRCNNCDLATSGLVNAKLDRVDLSGSDLRRANLSGADLSLANLTGADLSGASLAGANLAGANLTGAKLDSADLRWAYLAGANFTDTSLNTFYITSTVGLLEAPVSAEKLHQWGFVEGENENYEQAIAYYSVAAQKDPDEPTIYLSRAVTNFKLKNYMAAQQDITYARSLFEAQGILEGVVASDNLLAQIEVALNPDKGSSGSSIGNAFTAIGSLLMRFLF